MIGTCPKYNYVQPNTFSWILTLKVANNIYYVPGKKLEESVKRDEKSQQHEPSFLSAWEVICPLSV